MCGQSSLWLMELYSFVADSLHVSSFHGTLGLENRGLGSPRRSEPELHSPCWAASSAKGKAVKPQHESPAGI